MSSLTDMPLISIAIPSYNHGQYIQKTIQSVIDQDYEFIELIIVDDGSADESIDVIRSMVPACEARFVRFEFRVRPNKGLAATLNEMLEWASGTYFSGIASDDILLPHKTSTLLRCIEGRAEFAGVFASCYRIDAGGRRIGTVKTIGESCSFEDLMCRRRNPIAPTQLLKLDCLKRVGGYKTDLFIEDFYMWLALTVNGSRLGFIDSILVEYRQHDDNMCGNPLEMYEERIRVFAYFSTSSFYGKAMAINSLLASGYCSSFSKTSALRYMYEGFGYHKRIVFNPIFLKSVIKLVIPKKLLGVIITK
jgi:glycosyltransferase involved in cell wall biosynthesis